MARCEHFLKYFVHMRNFGKYSIQGKNTIKSVFISAINKVQECAYHFEPIP